MPYHVTFNDNKLVLDVVKEELVRAVQQSFPIIYGPDEELLFQQWDAEWEDWVNTTFDALPDRCKLRVAVKPQNTLQSLLPVDHVLPELHSTPSNSAVASACRPLLLESSALLEDFSHLSEDDTCCSRSLLAEFEQRAGNKANPSEYEFCHT